MKKSKEYRTLIDSHRWRKLRRSYMLRHPLCEVCLDRYNRTKPATEVHHKKPIEDAIGNSALMESLAYDEGNLMSVCRDCHTQLHIELNSMSKEANRKRKDGLTAGFVQKFFPSS
ncbi:hypothetical protein HQ40_03955 [Porphyromonas gulae]|uniref:HNH endonuclease signature motif containing protein n=1 Tax=Porphyromonas gulae TaxID=111105 RepID=UPI00052DA958|nr:hypothetical protein HQ40_03955 [Porphyromonas gulae]